MPKPEAIHETARSAAGQGDPDIAVDMDTADRGLKPATARDYARRIARVVDHIAAHLDGPLDIATLAEAACFSPFHFHRIYRTQTGETVAQTVRRYRLHRAATDLVAGRLALARVARRAGYGSAEAFSRAFAAHYGMAPAAFRDLPRDPVLEFPKHGESAMTEMLDVRIETRPPLRLAGLPHAGPFIEIGRAFEKTFAHAGAAGLLGHETRMIGLYYDDPKSVPERELRSFAAVNVPAEADPARLAPLEVRDLPGGRYAVAIHKGAYADLHLTWDRLFSAWLPQSGEEAEDRPALEEYLNNPRDTPPAELLTAVCLALKD
jgi:AraC family transcriptional regulator